MSFLCQGFRKLPYYIYTGRQKNIQTDKQTNIQTDAAETITTPLASRVVINVRTLTTSAPRIEWFVPDWQRIISHYCRSILQQTGRKCEERERQREESRSIHQTRIYTCVWCLLRAGQQNVCLAAWRGVRNTSGSFRGLGSSAAWRCGRLVTHMSVRSLSLRQSCRPSNAPRCTIRSYC